MKTRTIAVLLPLALLGAALAADAPADVKLPFNPIAGAATGDWALYKVVDPLNPDATVPPERLTVRDVKDGEATLVDTGGDAHRYRTGDDGAMALAFLKGFFGDASTEQFKSLRSLSVADDACEVGGKRYEGVRIDAAIVAPIPPTAPGGQPGEMKAAFKVWVAKQVHASGVVKADATVDLGGERHRGVLELMSHGTKDDWPPKGDAPAAPTGSARPAK